MRSATIANSGFAIDATLHVRLLEEVLEQLGVGVAICDASLTLVDWNRTAEPLLGVFSLGRSLALGDPLPEAIADFIRAQGETAAPATRRLESPDGARAVHVSAMGPTRSLTTLHLREETRSGIDVLDLLRRRFGLTAQEIQLVTRLLRPQSTREIARGMNLAESTVRFYLHRLFERTGVHSRDALIGLVERLGRVE